MLAPHENVLEALAVDLSADLCFQTGQIVLTDQRLLSRMDADPQGPGLRQWPWPRAWSCA